MNVSSSAYNLTDFALNVSAPQRQREIAFSMIKEGTVFQDMHMVTDPDVAFTGSRVVGGLPTIDWVPVNSPEPTVVKTDAKPYVEQSYAFANAVQISKLLLAAAKSRGKKPENLFNVQIKAFLKSMVYEQNDMLFNNAHVAGYSRQDLDCFIGIKARIMDSLTDQKYGVNPECAISAAATDLSDAGLTAALVSRILQYMDQALYAIGSPEGDDVIFYTNEDLLPRLNRGIRALGAGGGFDMTRDAFGRSMTTYKNAKIRSAGRKSPTATGTQAQIITSTENTAGTADTGGVSTSMYAVKTGEEDFYIQQAWALDSGDPYMLENKTMWQVVFHNAYMIVQPNTRATARIYNIKVA